MEDRHTVIVNFVAMRTELVVNHQIVVDMFVVIVKMLSVLVSVGEFLVLGT